MNLDALLGVAAGSGVVGVHWLLVLLLTATGSDAGASLSCHHPTHHKGAGLRSTLDSGPWTVAAEECCRVSRVAVLGM